MLPSFKTGRGFATMWELWMISLASPNADR
jgi:hypothetical protein